MIGLAWFAIVITYVVVSYKAIIGFSKLAKTKLGAWTIRLVILIIVLAFPVGDPLYSYYIYKSYCDEHAGPRIYRKVSGVDRVALEPAAANFQIPSQSDRGVSYPLLYNLGMYRYVEVVSGQVKEYSHPLPQHDKHPSILIKESVSMYKITLSLLNYNKYYVAEGLKIQDREGKTLATFQLVGWHGGGFTGPIFNFATGGYGPPKEYSNPREDVAIFVSDVLTPVGDSK